MHTCTYSEWVVMASALTSHLSPLTSRLSDFVDAVAALPDTFNSTSSDMTNYPTTGYMAFIHRYATATVADLRRFLSHPPECCTQTLTRHQVWYPRRAPHDPRGKLHCAVVDGGIRMCVGVR